MSNIGFDREGNLYVAELSVGPTATVLRLAADAGGFGAAIVDTLTSLPILYDNGVAGFSMH